MARSVSEGRAVSQPPEDALRGHEFSGFPTGPGGFAPPSPTGVRRSGSRLIPALMLAAAYVFAFWAFQVSRDNAAALPPGYGYMLVLTGVPFLLAAHGFALLRWNQLRRLDPVQGTVRDVTTDVSLSAWEIFFCWLGISVSLMFLYYAAPIAELKDWYPRFFLVLLVFFGATCQKALVFVFALLPFVATLTTLALWVYGAQPGPGANSVSGPAWVALLLAADLALLVGTVRLMRYYGGFRLREFQMPLGAGFVGGHLAGVIRTRQKSMPEAGFHLQLSCVRQYLEDGKRRQGRVLWHDRKTVRGDLPGARHTDASIPVIFEIPADIPASSSGGEEQVVWTLRATAALPESDFSCVFDVPVGRSDDPELLMLPTHLLHAPGARTPDPMAASALASGDGPGLRFNAPWNQATELVTAAYFLFWFQLVWLATDHEVGWETWLMFGAGLWFLGWVLGPWLASTEIGSSQGWLNICNRRLFTKRTTLVDPAEVKDIRVRPSSLRAGLMDGLEFHHLALERAQGKPVTAGRHLRDRWQAESIARAMKKLIAKMS